MKIISDIDKSINQARVYIEESFIKVKMNGNEEYWAFPHFKGKARATECGGTSSAVATLAMIHPSCVGVECKIESALAWLYKRQRNDGAWEASGLYCAEITARVLCDIKSYNPPSDVVDKALKYIVNCYNDRKGYFSSTPNNIEEPHIYTTYICLKALKMYDKDNMVDKSKIITWTNNSVSLSGNWGVSPKYNYGTIAHTIFSIYTLLYCEERFEDLKKKYSNTFIWLKKQISDIENRYDSDEIRIPCGSDEIGTTYYILKIGHNCCTLFGELMLDINELHIATVVAKKIVATQYLGGWGPEKDKITMWSIEYSVDFLLKYKEKFNSLSNVLKIYYSIDQIRIRLLVCLMGLLFLVGNIVWIYMNPEKLEDIYINILVSVGVTVLPWFVKRGN